MVPRRRPRPVEDGVPGRTVHLMLEGDEATVVISRADGRALRNRLRPFVEHARPSSIGSVRLTTSDPAAADGLRLSTQLREARLAALLGLSTTDGDAPGAGSLEALVRRTAEVYARSLTDKTRATYRRRWAGFSRFCGERELVALPATSASVMAYLAWLLDSEPAPSLSTMRGLVYAVNRIHREMDLRAPGDDPALMAMMRGLSASVPPRRAPQQVAALRIEDLRTVMRSLDRVDAVVVRDAALIRLTLAGATPGHLARLRWRDVRINREDALLGERDVKNGGGWPAGVGSRPCLTARSGARCGPCGGGERSPVLPQS